MVIHPQARTTPKLRAEIKAQRDRKQVDLAKQYNVTPQTIRKWQNRDEFTDKSHRPPLTAMESEAKAVSPR
ncbi:hypothetical protein [Thiolapillus sp.]|uniref:hypothetical protein n=1 Tax=Thiolapillus sp. TaxID=2017437 RepID=UPI003AF45CFB